MAKQELPKRAKEAERKVVGSIMLSDEALAQVRTILRPSDISDAPLAAVYAEMVKLDAIGAPIETATLVDAVRNSCPEFAKGGAAGYLQEVADSVADPSRAAYYASVVREAARKHEIYLFGRSLCDASLNCRPSETIINEASSTIDDWRREIIAADPRYCGISARELATGNYELRYLIDGFLVEGQPAFIGGAKKSLKTSLAMDLGLSLATGGYFLGKFRVNVPRRVVFLSGESGLATLQETALRICAAMNIDLAKVDGFTLTTTLPRLYDAVDLSDCERFLVDSGAETAIADPLYLMMSGDDAGNLFKQGRLLRSWSDMCTSIGVTGVLCHHTKSTVNDPFAPAELDHLAWSGCAEFARQWILLSRREQYEPGSGVHRLWLTAGGSAGHSSLWGVDIDEGRQSDPGGRQWAVGVNLANEARNAAQECRATAKANEAQSELDADRVKVCRLLAKYPDGASKTFIRDHCGVSNKRRWNAVFTAMFADRELVECEIKVSNQKTTRDGYKLNTETT